MRTILSNYKKTTSFMLVMVILILLAVENINTEITKAEDVVSVASTDYRCIGYYASWAGYARGYYIDDIDYDNITHLNFAFANLKTDGTVIVGDEWIDCQITSIYPDAGFTWEDQANNKAGHFGMLKKIKESHPNLKTLISIGGWTWSSNFSDVAADATKRETMANSAVAFILKYGFDGIDIDWEYPVEGGNNITHRSTDSANYLALVKLIRQKLNAQSAIDGKSYLLTIAAPANQNYVKNLDVSSMLNYLDWINLMTYDYHGGWDTVTNHNAPLYLNPNDPSDTKFSIDNTVKAYLSAGAEARDLNLGLPFYGRGWANVDATKDNCLFHSGSAATSAGTDSGTWEGASFDYWDIAANYIGKRGYIRYWDEYAKCPYLYSTQTKVFISYDDTQSLSYKLDYLKSMGLGGAMFWEFSGDRSGEMLSYTADQLGISGSPIVTPTPSLTPTATPAVTPTVTPTATPGVTPTPTSIPSGTIEEWNSTTVYVAGNEVIYNGDIYKAKWWTRGDVPGAIEWGSWEYVRTAGAAATPIPSAAAPTATPIPTPALTASPTPTPEAIAAWSSIAIYTAGNMVTYNETIYKAKWWTQGDTPGASEWGPWENVR